MPSSALGLGGSQLVQTGLGGTGVVGSTQQPSTFPTLSMPTPMVPLAQSRSQPLSQPQGVGPGQQSPLTSAFSTPLPAGTPSILTGMVGLQPSVCNAVTPVKTSTPTSRQAGLDQLDALGKSMLQQSLASKVTTSSISTPTASTTGSPVKTAKGSTTPAIESLAGLHVPLATIQPGSHPPMTAYDKNNLKIVIHFGRDRPRPDVHVMVVSVMSTNTNAVKTLTFLAAVPKTMKVKLQTPSATDLPAYNPILPPAAITQVMLIANPQNEKIRLKFKLSYSIDTSSISDVGDVDDFPVP
ncbi:hypothetical protein NP493_2015g00000 [Ridgeia piscesae]|uniref:GAE domain-containing protein n=1 Tax=Ridgeia piscesae TaxID=27915 RepID=A0AAD9JNG2_RIDPI|nr:hypothetical protein NP493_2015g00000 [Ridgeia piscesae]